MSTNSDLSGMGAEQRRSPQPAADDVKTEAAAVAPLDSLLSESAEIAQLAALSPLDYERERVAAANKLGLRAPILDKLVAAVRRDERSFAEQGRALAFPSPEPWHETVDGATLLNDLTRAMKRFLVMEDGAAETVALWVIHAHALDAFVISPRLAITSP
jgi:hypothetical protein